MGVQKSRKGTRFFKANLCKYAKFKENYSKNKRKTDFLLTKHKFIKSKIFILNNLKTTKPLFFDN